MTRSIDGTCKFHINAELAILPVVAAQSPHTVCSMVLLALPGIFVIMIMHVSLLLAVMHCALVCLHMASRVACSPRVHVHFLKKLLQISVTTHVTTAHA